MRIRSRFFGRKEERDRGAQMVALPLIEESLSLYHPFQA